MTMPDMVGRDASRQPVVTIKEKEVFADSRDVAVSFDKRHADVLRAIRELIGKEPDLGQRNFAPLKINDLTGETTSHYEMDRRGFILLAMGFTGDKALKWKLRYIDAFEAMEAELRRQAIGPVSNPQVLLGCFQALQAQAAAKDVVIAELKPKAELVERIAEAPGAYNKSVAAKMLQMPPHELGRQMRTIGWVRQVSKGDQKYDVAYQQPLNAGFLMQKVTTGVRGDGSPWTGTQVYVTHRGLTELARRIPQASRGMF